MATLQGRTRSEASAEAMARMPGPNITRWAGVFGVAGFFVFLFATPLYFLGPQPVPPLEDAAQFSEGVRRASTLILARATLADPIIFACLLIFLVGFRHLIQRTQPEFEWAGTLVFGAGLVLVALELVGDALQGAAALDTFAKPDPTIVRGLMEASLPLFGAIGLIMSALFLASAGYATLAAEALPRWTGWLALAGAVVNLVAAPSIFGGTDFSAFYTAAGWVTYIGQLTLVSWFVIASIAMVRKREVPPPPPVQQD